MKLIAALGNSGARYARSRHNAGWLLADELAARYAASWQRQGSGATLAEVAEMRLDTQKVLLVKPYTSMNSSGEPLLTLMQFYKLSPDDLLVMQDDLDSPFGLLKIRFGGRHGGQNGLRDIIRALGSEAFARLKLGISRPPAHYSVVDWVLSQWSSSEEDTLRQLVTLGADAAQTWATQGLKAAQAQVNGTDLRPRAPEPSESAP